MTSGILLLFIFVLSIVVIILLTSRFHLHPFVVLILVCFGVGFASGMPGAEIVNTIGQGFGNILSYIGLVIVLGTIIGVFLEKSGAALTIADTIIKLLGAKRPLLAMSAIGYLVSIPVFCDSAYVILSSLKDTLALKTRRSKIAMSIALATGLYATHTLVPPTPGPIAAAANLGLTHLGMVIVFGLVLAAIAALAGYIWAKRTERWAPFDVKDFQLDMTDNQLDLPGTGIALAPIIVPILLICLGSLARFPGRPLGEGWVFSGLVFLGAPLVALFFGFVCALFLLPSFNPKLFSTWVSQGIQAAAPILVITGAGGAFGAVLKATPIGDYLGETLSGLGLGIFLPFVLAAALKTAQGSSTVALVTSSAMVAPLLGTLGLASEVGRVLAVMAIGAGAMTVSHANDSYFWVVSQFSDMDVPAAYKSHTLATLIQGVVALIFVFLLSLIFV